MLEQAVAADTRSLFGKIARSLEGNVDVEPPSSMDDSSMILIEIGVDVWWRPSYEHGDPNTGRNSWSNQGDQSNWWRRRQSRSWSAGEPSILLSITPWNSQWKHQCRCQNRRISGRGSRTVRLGSMVTEDMGHDVFTQVRALSMEVKPYSCLINIDDMGSTRVDLPRDQGG